MLLKLEGFSDVGRFAKLRQKAPQFSKLALIYARNAQGKSTICGVLNSAATGNPQLLATRRRLGAAGKPEAKFLWGTSTVSFTDGRWNACPGPLHVFDHDYVERNVHTSGSVTRANKRQLLQTVIGEDGIKLSGQIEALDAELKKLAGEQATAARVIQSAHKAVTNVEAFCAAPVPEDIDARLEQRQRAVQLAKKAVAVTQRSDIGTLQLHEITAYESVLSSSLDGVSASAAEQVTQHIEQHLMGAAGTRWLRFGVEHTVGAACPFCTQDTRGVSFVEALKGYFSKAYASHVELIESAERELGVIYGENGLAVRLVLEKALTDVKFWSEVADLPSIPALSNEEIEQIVQSVRLLREALMRKSNAPTQVSDLGAGREQVISGIKCLRLFNAQVKACAPAIAAARAEAQQPDVAKAVTGLEVHQAWKAKTHEPMKSEADAFSRREERKKEIAAQKSLLQQQLRDYVARTVTSRQGEINRLLRRFGANFEITDTKASFVGREANTEYSLVVGKHVLKVGEGSETEPSFKTVLSAGDKFTLALAFFLTQVRADARLKDAVIVLDDPFNSQDMQRQFETANEIRSFAQSSCQVIVLSHDPRFLHLIEKDVTDNSCSAFQIVWDDNENAGIKEWSSAEELKSMYVRQAERIRHNAETGNYLRGCSPDGLVKELRPFMEDFIKQRFPGRFRALDMLEAMTNEIEDAGPNDPLQKDIADLRALNVYTRQYMHGGAVPPDPDQLRAQCRRVVDIIGRY